MYKQQFKEGRVKLKAALIEEAGSADQLLHSPISFFTLARSKEPVGLNSATQRVPCPLAIEAAV